MTHFFPPPPREASMSRPWQGRLGSREFMINAKGSQAALDLADQIAGSYVFSTKELINEDCKMPTDFRDHKQGFDARLLPGSGAWSVGVTRLGHATEGGSENDSDYFIDYLRLDGPEPHAQPHAQDDPAHWAAVALAISEQLTLAIASATPATTDTPTRRPSL